jgi:hypothetical protein
VQFGYFTLSDNHYDNNMRSANAFVTDIIDEAVYADLNAASNRAANNCRMCELVHTHRAARGVLLFSLNQPQANHREGDHARSASFSADRRLSRDDL